MTESNQNQEARRVSVLRSYGILNSNQEADLDNITRIAMEICGTPGAYISLVDEKMQLFKAATGINLKQIPRETSFCQHTVAGDGIYEVEDASKDAMFANNPAVTKLGLRFYAGAPIVNPDGYKLGGLCVVDTVPKKLSGSQREALEMLSRLVMNQLELKRKKFEMEQARNFYHKMVDNAGDIIYTTNKQGEFVFVNSTVKKIAGYSESDLLGRHFTHIMSPDYQAAASRFYRQQMAGMTRETHFEFPLITASGHLKWMEQTVVMIFENSEFVGFEGIVRDIHQRKQMEERYARAHKSAEETRKTLLSILDNTTTVVCIKDLKKRYMLVNRQFEKVFDVTFRNVHLKSDQELFNGSLLLDLENGDESVLADKKAMEFEFTGFLNDEKRSFMATKFPLFNDNGELYAICGVYTEITGQKKMQEQLSERDERFTKLFHSSPAAMVLSTITPNKLVEINRSFTNLTGFTREEVKGRSTTEIGMVDDKLRLSALAQFKDAGFLKNLQISFLDKTGRQKTALLSTEVIEIGGEKHALSMYYDITERLKSEQELAHAQSLLSEAMTIGRMGNFEYNHSTGHITWSEEISRLLEMDAASGPLSYVKYHEAIHPLDRDALMTGIQNNIIFKTTGVYINRFITFKGNIKWIETRIVPVTHANGTTLLRGTMQDITERKEAEVALLNAKEMAEQSARAKEQFLANMSHEIRTPMNAVLGFTDLLLATKLEDEQKEYVEAIDTSGKNLMTIINDILDYSKIEAGMMTFEKIPFSVKDLFNSLALLFGEKARQKNLELTFNAHENIPAEVIGDSARLTQIITNLVGNALKFTDKGFIKIDAGISGVEGDDMAINFTVQDSGIGIPSSKLNSVFERFNQASNDTTRKYGGTGLGLSIVKKLTELQGGTVSIRSVESHGSVFKVSIPFKVPAKETKAAKVNARFAQYLVGDLNGLEILLAEDNTMNQKLALKVLSSFGCRVEVASNGKTAIEKLRSGTYDLVLMDMQMPEMNGYEATAYIREELKSRIPIIAMTAHAMSAEREKCLSLGMNEYITKPFKSTELHSKISLVTAGSRTAALKPAKTASVQTQEEVLDTKYLESLSDGDENFVKDLLNIFVTEVPKDLLVLKQAINENDFVPIGQVAHKLISSVSLVGLGDQLAFILREMESLAKKKEQIPRIKTLYSQLDKVSSSAITQARALR